MLSSPLAFVLFSQIGTTYVDPASCRNALPPACFLLPSQVPT